MRWGKSETWRDWVQTSFHRLVDGLLYGGHIKSWVKPENITRMLFLCTPSLVPYEDVSTCLLVRNVTFILRLEIFLPTWEEKKAVNWLLRVTSTSISKGEIVWYRNQQKRTIIDSIWFGGGFTHVLMRSSFRSAFGIRFLLLLTVIRDNSRNWSCPVRHSRSQWLLLFPSWH